MLFTDFVPDPEARYNIGWYYLAASLGNLTVHLFYLINASYRLLRRKVREKLYRRKLVQAHAAALKK